MIGLHPLGGEGLSKPSLEPLLHVTASGIRWVSVSKTVPYKFSVTNSYVGSLNFILNHGGNGEQNFCL